VDAVGDAGAAGRLVQRGLAAVGLAREDEREVVVAAAGERLHEAARRAGVADRVHHLGFVSRTALPALLRRAVAMVFPSLYEGFGAPPLEAMACGCPVASSTRASLDEIVAGAARTFDPESVDDIAAALDEVAGDAAVGDRLRAAGLRNVERFSWPACADATLRAYGLALARR